MWRLVYAIPSWILFLVLRTICILLGWVLVPIAALCKAYKSEYDPAKDLKKENPIVYHFTWSLMFIWDNFEDGIANDMYYKSDSLFKRIIYWSCIRNPANNLRVVPHLSCKIDPIRVRYIGNQSDIYKYDTKIPQWFFAWQGVYSNLFYQFKIGSSLYRFWIGWKIFPTDIYGVTSYRKDGAGFATQFKKISK